MPQLGESIAEATIVNVGIKVGEQVSGDQEVIEVETNKAVMSVTTPCAGRVEELLVEVQQSYPVGAVLGYLDVSEEDAARLGPQPAPAAVPPRGRGGAASRQERRAARGGADRPRPAGARTCRRRELHVPPHEGAHE